MRKKIYALLLTATMALSATGCQTGSLEDTETQNTETQNTETQNTETQNTETQNTTGSVGQETMEQKETTSTDKETTSVDKETTTSAPEETTEGNEVTTPGPQSSYSILVSREGSTKITRFPKGKGVEADPGTWTIFVYMCGSDLETKGQSATKDLQEMTEATLNKNIKYVVFTGGAKTWHNNAVDSEKNQILVISDGGYEVVYEKEIQNMGDAATLAEFINYGVTNYPAEKMGIAFWNHGGGSVRGVCVDERYDDDSLTLREIDAALFNVRNKFDVNFEFIGFDACLMGTLETANVMATYANYMFGSEETEPSLGWDYTAIGNFLAENPTADGAALGQVVADSYYEACKEAGQYENITFGIYDLSQIDALIEAYNQFFGNVYAQVKEKSSAFASAIRGIYSADNFGGNNIMEGYMNMVDIGGIVYNLSQDVEGADAVFTALDNVVKYNINGSNHAGVLGVSTYYPLDLKTSRELSVFAKICTSPHYISLVDMVQRSWHDGTSVEEYSNDEMFDADGWLQRNEYDYDVEKASFVYEDEKVGYFDYLDEAHNYDPDKTITYEVEPSLTENGTFHFVLDDHGYNNTILVNAMVSQAMNDGKIIEIGQTQDVNADWETGEFSDAFDGYWISLPDGQNLALTIAETTEDYVVYTSPITLNGENMYLRIIQYYEDSSIEIQSAWEGIGENGSVSRNYHSLKDGDEIVPIYHVFKSENETYKGKPYIYDSKDELSYERMDMGSYFYEFVITNIHGLAIHTSYVQYNIDENGNITFPK